MFSLVGVDEENLGLSHTDPMSNLIALQDPSGTILLFERQIESGTQRLFRIFYGLHWFILKFVDEVVNLFSVLDFFPFYESSQHLQLVDKFAQLTLPPFHLLGSSVLLFLFFLPLLL
jgi:hypothetical protein